MTGCVQFGSFVPLFLFSLGRRFYLSLQRQSDASRLLDDSNDAGRQLLRARELALRQQSALKPQAEKVAAAEREVDGLIILEAVYGIRTFGAVKF
jgi:hypothetical protein